jgi:AraC-like DNA-binding protein
MRREELRRHLLALTPDGQRNALPSLKASAADGPSLWDALECSVHQSLFCLKREFPEVPDYTDDCLTIRFVYSGQAVIDSPDHSFCLHPNDLCLFNRGFLHSRQLWGSDDLIFLLRFDKEYLLTSLLNNMKDTGECSRFIFEHIINNANPQNYIIFHGEENCRITEIIEDMLCEFLSPTNYGGVLLDSYLKILLIEMMHCSYTPKHTTKDRQSAKLAEILNYIDDNYRTVTLDVLAEEFNYNSKYISRLIKVHTGKNFKDLILEKRMAEVCALLTQSDLSISQILIQTGMNNETYFYKKFRELYGTSPNVYRRAWYHREEVS